MSTSSVLKKAAIVTAGSVPAILMLNIQPAAAGDAYTTYSINYPNCSRMDIGLNDYATNNYAFTAGVCFYSGGMNLVKIKYKDAGGVVQTYTDFTDLPYEANASIPDGTILRTCHQVGQHGYPWGPAVWIDANTRSWGWTGSNACDF